jgi:hypothetical protein
MSEQSDALPRKASRAEFARIAQRDPAWITRLEQAGRLVIDRTDDMILVAESLESILTTAGGRMDVADRLQREREARSEATVTDIADATHRRARADAELRIKRAEADRAELARDREAGALVALEDAERAMRDLGATVRVELEQLAERVAPMIAGHAGDIGAITGVIAAECNDCLRRIHASLLKNRDALSA